MADNNQGKAKPSYGVGEKKKSWWEAFLPSKEIKPGNVGSGYAAGAAEALLKEKEEREKSLQY